MIADKLIMLKLATILDNPGEPLAETQYRDPALLRQLGYNGLVIYETTGLSGVESPESVRDSEIRRWIAQQFDQTRQRIEQAIAAGLDVYFFYDVLSLTRDTVSRDITAFTCKNRPNTLCPASEVALERSVAALRSLLQQWPMVRGVVLRMGDNDAARLPYLIGNDIYTPHCARCSQLGRADRITLVLNQFHDLVVKQMDKRLIARAWNVRPNGLHDSVELCHRVMPRLPGADNPTDDRFVLSFKFTHTDFWRYQRWNPSSLIFRGRPILYELQCQREFEAKGGVPNWQVPLWRDGPPEAPPRNDPGIDTGVSGLAEASGKVNLAGLWAWVRGGGWGGPFVHNETWIDSNVFAVPKLADHPDADPATLAQQWIEQRLHVHDPAVARAITQVLVHSPEIARKGFYIGPFARSKNEPWHPNGDWIQDDLLDARAAWRMIQRLPDSILDEVVREKQEAVEQIAADRNALGQVDNDQSRPVIEPMIHTLIYAESLMETLRDLLAGLVAYRRYQRSKDPAQAETCRKRLIAAQSHWIHHTQRHGSLHGAATAFREIHFWDLTQQILGELG